MDFLSNNNNNTLVNNNNTKLLRWSSIFLNIHYTWVWCDSSPEVLAAILFKLCQCSNGLDAQPECETFEGLCWIWSTCICLCKCQNLVINCWRPMFQLIDYGQFRRFLTMYLEVEIPDDLSRHLFLSFLKRPTSAPISIVRNPGMTLP